MASLLSVFLLLLVSVSVSVASTTSDNSRPSLRTSRPPHVPSSLSKVVLAPAPVNQQACRATRFPDACTSSLAQSPSLSPNSGPIDLILAAIAIPAHTLKTAQSTARSIVAASAGDRNRTNAATNCIELLEYSDRRLARTADAVTRGRVKDARAWASAALLYQYDCFSALNYVNGTKQVVDAAAFLASLSQLTSNALSMLAAYDHFGNETSAWAPPKTERDGYWGDDAVASGLVEGGKCRAGFPSDMSAPDARVCKDGAGDGCYWTVQEAVNAAPDYGTERFVIHIKEGVYQEMVQVPYEKTNVVFLGDGMGKTVITGSRNATVGVNTYNTATVAANGDGFMAKGLTFENTAGPDAHQAVAFRSDSDLSMLEEVELLGHQDTLYAHSLRQFYKSCRIAGTVDFIFGNSAAVFQDCLLLVRPRQVNPKKSQMSTVTAHGRTDPAQATGFLFHHCVVNGTDDYLGINSQKPVADKNYLGRPWKEYSRTVFVRCYLEELISPEGWTPWTGDFALKTLFYGEFESRGPGANSSARVDWSSQIPAAHLGAYSVERFIQGGDWIPGRCQYSPSGACSSQASSAISTGGAGDDAGRSLITAAAAWVAVTLHALLFARLRVPATRRQ